MNRYHRIGLGALVWYLLMPPLLPNGKLDIHAPMWKWDEEGRFPDRDACADEKRKLLKDRADQFEATFGQMCLFPTPKGLEMPEYILIWAECVPAGDPRLR
jgi:hypothetical protein